MYTIGPGDNATPLNTWRGTLVDTESCSALTTDKIKALRWSVSNLRLGDEPKSENAIGTKRALPVATMQTEYIEALGRENASCSTASHFGIDDVTSSEYMAALSAAVDCAATKNKRPASSKAELVNATCGNISELLESAELVDQIALNTLSATSYCISRR